MSLDNRAEAACKKAKANLHGPELTAEVKHLSAICQEGEYILLYLMNRGVTICASGLFAKQPLKHLARRPDINIQETTG